MNSVQTLAEQRALLEINLHSYTSGELAIALRTRATKGLAIRITHNGVRVTHSNYFDKLSTPEAIDQALAQNAL